MSLVAGTGMVAGDKRGCKIEAVSGALSGLL